MGLDFIRTNTIISQKSEEVNPIDLHVFRSMRPKRTQSPKRPTAKTLMKSFGVTQVELSKRMGITQSTVSEMLRSDKDPPLSTILRIATAIGCAPIEVMQIYDLYQDWLDSREEGE